MDPWSSKSTAHGHDAVEAETGLSAGQDHVAETPALGARGAQAYLVSILDGWTHAMTMNSETQSASKLDDVGSQGFQVHYMQVAPVHFSFRQREPA